VDDEPQGGSKVDQTGSELEALRAAIDDLRRRPVSVDSDQLRSVITASLSEVAAPPPNLLVTAITRLDRVDARLESIERALTGGEAPERDTQSIGPAETSLSAQPMVLPAFDAEAIAEALARRLGAAYAPPSLGAPATADRPVGSLPIASLLEALARVEAEVAQVTAAPDEVISAMSRLEAGVSALASALEEDREAQTRTLQAGLEEAGQLAAGQGWGAGAALASLEDKLATLVEALTLWPTPQSSEELASTILQSLGPVVEETRSGVISMLELAARESEPSTEEPYASTLDDLGRAVATQGEGLDEIRRTQQDLASALPAAVERTFTRFLAPVLDAAQARAVADAATLDVLIDRVSSLESVVGRLVDDPSSAVFELLTDQITSLEATLRSVPAVEDILGPLMGRVGAVDDTFGKVLGRLGEIETITRSHRPAVDDLAGRLSAIDDMVRAQPDSIPAITAMAEGLERLDQRITALPSASDSVLDEMRARLHEVGGTVDLLAAALSQVRSRVEASAGVIDISRRAADAGEAAATAVSALRSDLVAFGAGSARTTDQAAARLAALVEESIMLLTERMDRLTGLVERG